MNNSGGWHEKTSYFVRCFFFLLDDINLTFTYHLAYFIVILFKELLWLKYLLVRGMVAVMLGL